MLFYIFKHNNISLINYHLHTLYLCFTLIF